MKLKRAFLAVAASAAIALLAVPVALAATFGEGQNYTLSAGEVVKDDLYVFAQDIVIEGTVDGDVIAAGGSVTIAPTGVVLGDLMSAAEAVSIRGSVEDDVRAAGFTIQIEEGARVGGDVVAAGFSVGVAEGASVQGDLVAAGYQALVGGTVEGDVSFVGSALEISGTVDGDVTATVDAGGQAAPPVSAFPFVRVKPPKTITSGLHVADSARIGGDLAYTSPDAAAVPNAAVDGLTTHEQPEPDPAAAAREAPPSPATASERLLAWIVAVMTDYVALLVAGVLILLPAARFARAVGGFLAERTLPSLGWGCLTMIVAAILALVIPIASLLVALVLGAIHIGPLAKPVMALGLVGGVGATAGLYLLTWIGTVLVAVCLGRWILDKVATGRDDSRWLPLLVGLAAVAIAINLPYVGVLLKLLVATAGIGGMLLWSRRAWSAGGGTEPRSAEAM